jgi:hypothetical protein
MVTWPKESDCTKAGNAATKGNFAGDGCMPSPRQATLPKVGNIAKEGNFATKSACAKGGVIAEEGNYAKGGDFTKEVELAENSDLAVDGVFTDESNFLSVVTLPRKDVIPPRKGILPDGNFETVLRWPPSLREASAKEATSPQKRASKQTRPASASCGKNRLICCVGHGKKFCGRHRNNFLCWTN